MFVYGALFILVREKCFGNAHASMCGKVKLCYDQCSRIRIREWVTFVMNGNEGRSGCGIVDRDFFIKRRGFCITRSSAN